MYRCRIVLWASLFIFFGLGINVLGAGFPVAWGTGSFGLTNPPSFLTNVVAIAAGSYHNLAVLDDGTVRGWGDDALGKATPPAGLNGVVAVAAGGNHSVALRNNGRVVAWGDPTTTNVPAGLTDVRRIAAGEFHTVALRSNGTVVVWGPGQTQPGISGAINIAAGGGHSLALLNNGTVFAWGQNNMGQTTIPFGLNSVVGIAAGSDFSLALRSNGAIVGWGNPANGRTSPLTPPGVVAIAAGAGHGVALKNDRTVFCWGDNSLNQTVIPGGTSNVIAIAGGATHTLALRMHPPRFTAHPTPRAVLQGGNTTFTAAFTGSTPLSFQWRRNDVAIPNATNVTYTISNVQTNHAGLYSLLISNTVGTAVSTNATLTVNIPAFISQHPQNQSVAEGGTVSFSVVAGGTIPFSYQWQKNGTNLIPSSSSTYTIFNATTNHAGNYRAIVSNAFGMATSMVATLTVDPIPLITAQPQSQSVLAGASVTFSVSAQNATEYQWRRSNTNIAGANQAAYTINNVRTNDAGDFSVRVANQFGAVTSQVAVLTVNTLGQEESLVVQWGENPVFNGIDQVDITVPNGLTDVAAISAGSYHDLVLLKNGRVFGWGDSLFGQASSPATLTNGARITAGMHHSAVLTSNGTVVAWGANNLNQTNVTAGLTGVMAISAGANHTLALRSNGTVAAWGHTNAGQSTVPANTTNVMAIAAGFEHSMALLSNGTLRTWGNNDFGQRIPPPWLSNLVAIAGGKNHSVGLRNDGRVFAWGQNTFNQTNVPIAATNIIAIAAGLNHSMALRRDGRLFCWGQDNFLQLQPPEGLNGIVAIAAGGNRSLVLKAKLLRLDPPERLANGNVRLRIRNQDGSAMDASRASKIEVYASHDPGRPRAQWTKLSITLTLGSGVLQGEDPAPVASPRFYVAFEKP